MSLVPQSRSHFSGFSSLSFVQRLPLAHLKVAREFIPKNPEGRGSLAIARTIVTQAKSLGMRSTVEGIETNTQLESFRVWGCDQVRGYLFSQPLSCGDFRQLLQSPPKYDI